MVSHLETSCSRLDDSGALSQQERGARSKLLVDDVDLVVLNQQKDRHVVWTRQHLIVFGRNPKGRK